MTITCRAISASILCSCLALAWAGTASADFAIRDGDTVAFLGDSITAARTYGKLIENYTLLRFPDRDVKFINVGQGGDTAAGGLARLEEDVFAHDVTLLIVAYGVNDIGWGMRADDAHRQRYLDAIRDIVNACVERGVRVYICSAAVTGADPFQSEDSFLQKMCDEGMRIAEANGGHAIDVQRRMREIQKRVWKANERAEPKDHVSLHTEDTIHLNDLGQLAMAFAILKGLEAPADVSSAVLDAKTGEVIATDGCEISHIESREEQIAFTRLDQGLPLNRGVFAPLNYRFVPVPEELNRYLLTVKNLPDGQYQLVVSNREVGTFSRERLAAGVNISSATADPWKPGGPWFAQAELLASLSDARNTVDLVASRTPERLGERELIDRVTDQVEGVSDDLRRIERLLARPRPYRFVLTRVASSDDGAAAADEAPNATVDDRQQAPPEDPLAKAFEYLPDPPPVQVFVPGFTVEELPVKLTNINNVLYRDDGKLVALAYDGNIYLLSDSDGDGLEDEVSLYWENKGRIRAPIGMDLTPKGYERGSGVFVASKMECILILDTDGDNKADEVVTVAEGWPESFHQVDALGMEVDPRDGSVYFGIGTQNFADAYDVDEEGNAKFRIDGQRGTIQHVSPDFKSRKTIATGIRFPVAIRLNKIGDLFCTDQEGATWLPNGNPLDELLHIDRQRVRHYGFPPRHPKHLPGVIDEPSVFDYAPQHQSTCGLNFNESVGGGPVFGPSWWTDDAIVTGFSRGKLYRTTLVKTPSGYVAQNQLLASLTHLTADACISPEGALIVATHSGPPDWGSGPDGEGKLYKITYSDRDAPIPVKAWARTPHEVRVAFDRPLDPQSLASLAGRISIECGRFVAAGDRFEKLRPPYVLVTRQLETPRYDVKVLAESLSPDRRTLILSTAPHRAAVSYAITLPRIGAQPSDGGEVGLPQVAETDLAYDLTGVEAAWYPQNAELPWHGWLPHLDLAVARRFTEESAGHSEFWRLAEQAGTLTLRTQLRLEQMLRPEVQPGSEIDYEYPPEEVTIVLEANCPIEVLVDGSAVTVDNHQKQYRVELGKPLIGDGDSYLLEVRLQSETAAGAPSLAVSYYTNEDPSPRALPLRRMVMPWVTLTEEPQLVVNNRNVLELEGGDWLRGKEVFFGDKAMCARCHQMRGEGGNVGPDLSNLPHRDYASVLRDITQPSAAINPDFVTYTIETINGRVLTGTIRTQGEALLIGDQEGKETHLSREDVDAIYPSSISVMPEKISESLGPEKLRDLMTFLLLEPPAPPNDGPSRPAALQSARDAAVAASGNSE